MQRPYLHDAPDYTAHPELAVAALIRMLARFPMIGRASMAESIERHLDTVAADGRLPPAIRAAALAAVQDWRGVVGLPEDSDDDAVRRFS